MEAISPVLSGLIRKRAEMAGEADALRAKLAAIVANMGHVDAVIGLFDPAFDLATIRPKLNLNSERPISAPNGLQVVDLFR